MADNSLRRRKRTRNPDIWKRNLAKRKRASGEGYISRAGKPVAEAQFYDVAIPVCCKAKTSKACNFKNISIGKRRLIFEDFWKLGSYDLQSAHLHGLIEKFEVKRQTTGVRSRRQFTRNYFLNIPEAGRLKVCCKAFCTAFGVTGRRIQCLAG